VFVCVCVYKTKPQNFANLEPIWSQTSDSESILESMVVLVDFVLESSFAEFNSVIRCCSMHRDTHTYQDMRNTEIDKQTGRHTHTSRYID